MESRSSLSEARSHSNGRCYSQTPNYHDRPRQPERYGGRSACRPSLPGRRPTPLKKGAARIMGAHLRPVVTKRRAAREGTRGEAPNLLMLPAENQYWATFGLTGELLAPLPRPMAPPSSPTNEKCTRVGKPDGTKSPTSAHWALA